jgi:hypothetical protein
MSEGISEVVKVTKTYQVASPVSDRRFVALDSNGKVAHAGDGVEIKGVSMAAMPTTDGYVPVALINAGNIVQVESSAAVTLGAQVASAADGKAKDSASADIEVGQADEGSSAAAEYAIIHLTRGGVTT